MPVEVTKKWIEYDPETDSDVEREATFKIKRISSREEAEVMKFVSANSTGKKDDAYDDIVLKMKLLEKSIVQPEWNYNTLGSLSPQARDELFLIALENWRPDAAKKLKSPKE